LFAPAVSALLAKTKVPRFARDDSRSVSCGERFLRGVQSLLMIAKDLLEILVCPACKQPLEYRENPESLKCKQCRRVYAIKDDIPIMLVDEATIEA
jgi:uncharacterized protein YbaR (Trm112 family)